MMCFEDDKLRPLLNTKLSANDFSFVSNGKNFAHLSFCGTGETVLLDLSRLGQSNAAKKTQPLYSLYIHWL